MYQGKELGTHNLRKGKAKWALKHCQDLQWCLECGLDGFSQLDFITHWHEVETKFTFKSGCLSRCMLRISGKGGSGACSSAAPSTL